MNGTKPRSRVFASVPKSIWPPSLDLQGAFICRNNASEISPYLHLSGRIKQTADTKCRANHAYAMLLVLRSGIQGGMSARAMRPASSVDRHQSLLGVKQFDAANALQPYNGRGPPAAYVGTITAATWESGFEEKGWAWGDRIILGLIVPGMHRTSLWQSPPRGPAAGEVEPETAVGIVLIDTETLAVPISGLCSLLSWAAC